MAKGICIDVKAKALRMVECNGLEDYYREIGCNTIDIVSRKMGYTWYDFVVDDEGLFAETVIPSVFDFETEQPMLVGNVIILNHDDEGNETDLTPADVNNILAFTVFEPTLGFVAIASYK